MASNLTEFQNNQDVQSRSGNKLINRFAPALSRWLTNLSRYVVSLSNNITIENDIVENQVVVNGGRVYYLGVGYDLNNLTRSGMYDGISLQNSPVGGEVFVESLLYSYIINEATLMQRLTSTGLGNTANQSWQRIKDNGTWTPWKVLLA